MPRKKKTETPSETAFPPRLRIFPLPRRSAAQESQLPFIEEHRCPHSPPAAPWALF